MSKKNTQFPKGKGNSANVGHCGPLCHPKAAVESRQITTFVLHFGPIGIRLKSLSQLSLLKLVYLLTLNNCS